MYIYLPYNEIIELIALWQAIYLIFFIFEGRKYDYALISVY